MGGLFFTVRLWFLWVIYTPLPATWWSLDLLFWSFFTSSWWVFDDQGDGIYKSLWRHFCLWNWVPLIILILLPYGHLLLQLLSDDNSVKIQRCDLRRSQFFGMRKALAETTFSVCIRIHLDALHLHSPDLSFQSTKHKNHGHWAVLCLVHWSARLGFLSRHLQTWET